MSSPVFVILGALALSQDSVYIRDNQSYYDFPKFWTSSGLCPAGTVTHHDIKNSLQGDDMQRNILLISSLPKGAITHLRIHWLLELLDFIQYTQSGLPIYDYQDLDEFLQNLTDMGLLPVIEFMGNISNIFIKNPSYNNVIWEDLSYQVTKRYLNMFGEKIVSNWRFETWNEPDVLTYNKLNFTVDDYLIYTSSIQQGLRRAGYSSESNLHLPLRGPAGLFKSFEHHPLCWGLLEYCNRNNTQCPIDILTYHRKGNGTDSNILINESLQLISEIHNNYVFLRQLPISNDEADPISGWSVSRTFQEDARYADVLVKIVLQHWAAKLKNKDIAKLESISHDNAFLSYHPFEFSQRTLLAHFRMNNTNPPHSQFIQKPVYAALGILSRLAETATDILRYESPQGLSLMILKTKSLKRQPLYMSWLIVPTDQEDWLCNKKLCHYSIVLPEIHLCNKYVAAYILEYIDQGNTNPVKIWKEFGSPGFPNATVREAMRYHQSPKVLATGVLVDLEVKADFGILTPPWILLLRVCSNLSGQLNQPINLKVTPVTRNEVLLTWTETTLPSQCLRTYEVWFQSKNTLKWQCISHSWHLPFPSFQYAPGDGTYVNGYYKVRGVDVFNSTSHFSKQIRYIEI